MTTLAPADVESVWPEAGPLFEKALRGFDENSEDVLRACQKGEAFLFSSPVLLIVFKPLHDGILIWAAASRDRRAHAIRRHHDEIERTAARLGGTSCVFRTHRRGFGAILGRGWRERDLGDVFEWRKRLTYGP